MWTAGRGRWLALPTRRVLRRDPEATCMILPTNSMKVAIGRSPALNHMLLFHSNVHVDVVGWAERELASIVGCKAAGEWLGYLVGRQRVWAVWCYWFAGCPGDLHYGGRILHIW